MSHLLYLMFRCDRGCDGKFGKFVGTKHTPRCATVSEFWQHRAQLSSFWRPCRFLLAAVQHRSWIANHPKNLHLPGARVFARIFAPGIEYCPMKKDLYAEAVEKVWSLVHFQRRRSVTPGRRVTSLVRSQMRT